jgi:hypothetical protein
LLTPALPRLLLVIQRGQSAFPESNLAVPTQFRQVSNAEITQPSVDDPNSLLAAAIVGQNITNTIALIISTTAVSPISGGGTDGTAFLQGSTAAGPNASPAAMSAIFWIESVTPNGGGPAFLHTQTVLLNFKSPPCVRRKRPIGNTL